MIKKLLFIVTIVLSANLLIAQSWKEDKGVKWKLKLSNCVLGMGFIYQHEFLYQVGPKIDLRKKGENFSIIPSLQIQKHHVMYLSPAMIIRYYKPIKKWIGPVASLEYNYRTIQKINYSLLTPEIGININGACSIGYGYVIPLTNKPDWIWNHRIVIRLMNL